MKMKLTIEVESLEELSQVVERLKGTNVTFISEGAPPVTPDKSTEADVSYEDITRVLSEKAKTGKTSDIKELLNKHGVKSAKKLDPSQYSTFLNEAKTI